MYLRVQYRIPRRSRMALGRALEDAGLRKSKRQPALVAMIAESRRVDGKPRQRLIAYLGCIKRDAIHRVDGRHKFWIAVDQRLLEFVPEDRARFVAALEALVPRLTAEELLDLSRPTEEQARRTVAIEAARARMAAFRVEPPTTVRRTA